ncbi:sodium:proton exchanger [Puteibacter caeruleilacunae]|nr:sodium:proton exchanger [Puteibacter caeruleilacunae]
MSAYIFIIAICVVVIASFFFGKLSEKTRIPSVLLLIGLGIGIQQGLDSLGIKYNYFPILEILGIVGLIMIVLEAALDLKLSRNRWPIIWKSFVIAFLSLFVTSCFFSYILKLFIQNIDFITGLIYAIPLTIMSSAIVIPSVNGLTKEKKEFMVYESTFSDIMGIMFFYLLLQNVNASGFGEIGLSISGNIIATVLLSVVVSYLLLWLFQFIEAEAKIFLFIAILVLLFSIGKLLHLSSLLIILVFGLIMRNKELFIQAKLKEWINYQAIDDLYIHFRVITAESSFLLRTLFFVVFGMSLVLSSLLSSTVWIISLLFLIAVYGVRYLLFKGVKRNNMFPEALIAPRGLISVLLFFAIPEDFHVVEFESGILFVVILFTSIIMAWSLIDNRFNGSDKSKITIKE